MNNNNLNILIVEDDKNLGATLNEFLPTKGFNCQLATTVATAEEAFLNSGKKFQIILMDIGLPDGSGLELAKAFRNVRKDFVLLFLSALNDPETKLSGLELGAEDYITKPFDLRELTLRLDRILATSDIMSERQQEVLLGPLKIHFNQYEVIDAHGNMMNLSQKECAILEMLVTNKGSVVSRDQILEQIWGESAYPTNRTIDNYIVKLRKWTDTSDGQVQITAIRGIGYKLEDKG